MERNKNQFADTLATLTSMAKIDCWNIVQPISIEVRNSLAHCCSVKREVDENSWCNDIKQFIQHRKVAMNYYLDVEVLYKKLFDGTLLKCLDGTEAKKMLWKVLKKICATHASGHMTAR
jgi:hypothetical protein